MMRVRGWVPRLLAGPDDDDAFYLTHLMLMRSTVGSGLKGATRACKPAWADVSSRAMVMDAL
jgi:hypothetical protein